MSLNTVELIYYCSVMNFAPRIYTQSHHFIYPHVYHEKKTKQNKTKTVISIFGLIRIIFYSIYTYGSLKIIDI